MPEQAPAQQSPLAVLPMFVMMFLIFYVLVFRPQAKQRKQHEQMIKNLKKHDEVVTVGGIFGSVVNIKPDAVTLKIDENVRVDVEPSAISRLAKKAA
jgi:preprotein translocase subunit YajC